MTQTPTNLQPGASVRPTNWARMIRVWLALAGAMTVTMVVGLAALPTPAPAPPASGPPVDAAALEAIVWPRDMVPAKAWRYIVIHHSATNAGTLEAFDQGHRDRGFEHGVGYHFIINNGRAEGTGDGQILPTPRWLGQLDGAHTKVVDHPEFNTEGIGICLVGNFDQYAPSPAQMTSLQMLVMTLRDRYDIPLEHIVGHGELKNTRCPGRLFPLEAFLMDLRQAHLKSRVLPTATGTK